jgi:malate/lactate dehydrogenase
MRVDAVRLGGLVLGEHGDTQVPIWSSVTLDGHPFKIVPKIKEKVTKTLDDWYPHWQAQNSGRTTTWTSAVSMLRMLETVKNREGLTIGSVPLSGEYGLADVALGVPLEVDSDGLFQVRELDLDKDEKRLLKISSRKVKELFRLTKTFPRASSSI